MKKTFTLFTVLYFISQGSIGQFTKGQKLIGGNVSFSTNSGNMDPNTFNNNNINHTSNTGIGINISASRFVDAKTLWGIGLMYNTLIMSLTRKCPRRAITINMLIIPAV